MSTVMLIELSRVARSYTDGAGCFIELARRHRQAGQVVGFEAGVGYCVGSIVSRHGRCGGQVVARAVQQAVAKAVRIMGSSGFEKAGTFV